MKKRILALALAGTTAFSVFGAALSANAATYDSTDKEYKVDAYMSYTPVAKTVSVSPAVPVVTDYAIDRNPLFRPTPGNAVTFKIDPKVTSEGTNNTYSSVEAYIKAKYDVKEEYTAQTKYTYTRTVEKELEATKRPVTLYVLKTKGETYIRAGKYGEGTDREYTTLNGTYYIDKDATIDEYGVVSGTIYYSAENSGDKKLYSGAENVSSLQKYTNHTGATVIIENGKYQATGSTVTVTTDTATGEYTYDGVRYKDADALLAAINDDYSTCDTTKQYVNGTTVKDEKGFSSVKWLSEYDNNIDRGSSSQDGTAAAISVTDRNGQTWKKEIFADGTIVEHYKEWKFNGDMTGETTVSPYEVDTSIVNGKLNVTKTQTPTIYAYDFLATNEVKDTASSIANKWNYGTITDAAAAIGSPMTAQTGRGVPGAGIRYDVVSEWQSFLSELSILDGSYYGTISEKEFKDMYLDRFYSDPVYDSTTGLPGTPVKVDLYNIEDLLDDIWDLRTQSAYYAANTSEMVYLMQQYDKYIGDYIDQGEVSTDEWGDLLVDLLNAATSDNFKSALDYNRYAAEVSRLTANYQNALTSAQVIAAEKDMYTLLTNSNAGYYAAKTADKTALAATMDGLYFNVGTIPTQYSVNPSTATKVSSDVDYTNYNYYVAALNVSKPTYSEKEQNLYFTSTLTTGYYSLYPMLDYIDYDYSTANEVYAGNVDANGTFKDAPATAEYEWFWNVYQLAANMNKNNKYQGSVDAVNDALNAAVAELAVTTAPSNTETGALADAVAEYEGKIDTDYNEGYYAKYTQANDYAENVAEGKWQTRIAAMITGVAGEALTYQGTQVTVTKNDMETVKTAIKNGETALKAIKEDADYNAAQVTALNKAIDQAEYLVSLYEGTYSKLATQQSVNKQWTYLTGDKDQMVKSDLTAAIEAIDAAINYSEIIMGWSKNDAGKWQYGTEEGYLSNGWNKIGSVWYYFNEDGTAKQSEWFKENGKWYWLNSNCGAAYGWAKVDGKWYYFNGDNSMRTGWVKVEGNWYYLASSGAMVTGWCEVDGKWYYFSKKENALGQMECNTTIDGYKLGADGAWIK